MSETLAKPKSADKEFIYLKPHEIAVEDDFNVRLSLPEVEEMLQSILVEGIQFPLHVRNQNGVFVLEAGHRRLAAVKLGIERKIDSPHLVTVPCRTVKTFCSPAERLMLQLVRNQSVPLTIWEQALALQQLRELKVTDQDILTRWGISLQHFKNLIRISNAPAEMIELVKEKRMAPSTVIDATARFSAEELPSALQKAIRNAKEEDSTIVRPRHFPGNGLRATKRDSEKSERINTLLDACNARLKSTTDKKERVVVKTILDFLRGKRDLEELVSRVQASTAKAN